MSETPNAHDVLAALEAATTRVEVEAAIELAGVFAQAERDRLGAGGDE